MKTILAPSVHLIGQSQVNDSELDRFLTDNDVAGWETDTLVGGEKLVEVAGRLCYMSFAKPRPGGNRAYVDHILDVGHGSVAEHFVFNLVITGVSRSLTHELVRSRAGMSYSQLSQRYVDESDVAFVVPPALIEEVAAAKEFTRRHFYQGDIPANRVLGGIFLDRQRGPTYSLSSVTEEEEIGLQWLAHMEASQSYYTDFSDYMVGKFTPSGVRQGTPEATAIREAARSVLPNATETKIFVSGNGRSLRHLIEMRGSRHADAEIRRLSIVILSVLADASPALFGDYRLEAFADGQFEITTPHPKV